MAYAPNGHERHCQIDSDVAFPALLDQGDVLVRRVERLDRGSDQRIGQVSSCVPWCTSTGSVIRSKYRCGEAARQIWSDLSWSPYVRAIRRLGSIELVPVV